MPNWMRYTILPVGQGVGTLVQVFDDTNELLETSLIDLGSARWFKKQTGIPSADFVVKELRKMKDPGPTLTALFLSHSDRDHINLIRPVLEAFYKPSEDKDREKTLEIQDVWYGGKKTNYVKKTSKFDLIEEIRKYKPKGAKDNINRLEASQSSWGEDPDPGPLVRTDEDVGFWLLLGNIESEDVDLWSESEKTKEGDDGYLLNVVSLVVVVEYGATPRYFVAPGDATGLTIAGCNEIIENKTVNLAPVATIGLPHHGSERTTYNLLISKKTKKGPFDLATAVVQKFVKLLKPETITASA